ncbi:MAG: MlaD family protein [Muribaculaceae bacterium]
MKKKLGKEFIIGLSVILAIGVLITGIDYLKGINIFQPTNSYEVYYSNAAGLEKSAPVMLNGFKVGLVRDVSIDYAKPDKVKVVLALDNSLHLPDGTTAQLGSTLLSGAMINLIVGSGPGVVAQGSVLPATESADMMTALQEEVLPAVSGIIPKIDSLLYNLNVLVADPALLSSIQRLDGITGNLYAASGSLNSAVGAVNGQLPAIMRNASHASVRLDTIADNLAALSADLRTLPLQSTMANVERVTANLEAFSAQLNNPESTLGRLTTDPQLYNQLNRVTADVDSLIVDIKRNPKRYISIKLL